MEMACDLEVVVNGEESFFVDKGILPPFCGRLSESFRNNSKVELNEVPGGAAAFELIARFCYGNGMIRLTAANTCLLHCAACFMVMPGLIESTEKSLEGVSDWMWSEVVGSLKQCRGFARMASSSGALGKLLDSLVSRIAAPGDAGSPSGSSPESSGLRCSFDTRSTQSTRTGQRAWWFEDVSCLGTEIVEKAVKLLISRKLDHVHVSRFLFYYLRVGVANAGAEEKRKATESVVDLLYSLDRSSVPGKSLFGVLRAAASQNVSKLCRVRLERMIGVRIDQLTLDNLLVPAPMGVESMYDVDLVLRFLKAFADSWGRRAMDRLKKVGGLIDLYLTEVAPDSGLKPSKFVALAGDLPDAARDSYDAMYRAIDMYLEVHPRLSEEERTEICCAINYEKLSSESCKHLAQNAKFPPRTAIQALASQHSKLKSLLKDTDDVRDVSKQSDGSEQIVLYARKLDLSAENEKLRANLKGMQWKVMELERVCRKMQAQMAKMTRSRKKISCSHRGSSGSLPKLCS